MTKSKSKNQLSKKQHQNLNSKFCKLKNLQVQILLKTPTVTPISIRKTCLLRIDYKELVNNLFINKK